jgi:non-heme chloroperoxidase
MPYLKVGQENSAPIEIHYEDHGSGDPVVLIHGFPFSGRAWEKEETALLNAGYRVITYDRRGFGDSSKPTKGYDYDTFTHDLDVLLDVLLTSPGAKDVVLVGHSMGTGEVTHYLATKGSKGIKKGVLISPIPPFLLKTRDNPTGVDKSVFDQIQESILDDRFAYLTQFNNDFFNVDENMGKSISQETLNGHWNIAALASPEGTYQCVPTWLTDFRDDLPKLDVPILVIQGDEDRILPYESTGKLLKDKIKDCKLVTVEGGPHGIPWTHADVINKELIQFMKS